MAAAGRSVLLAAVIAGLVLAAPGGSPRPAAQPANASTLVAGFEETEVISGLTNPTVVRFASDGRVFVAEKSGLIKVFSDLSDPSPTVFADLRTNVHNFWDRGLLGLALAPNFPSDPYVYVAYTFNHVLGSPSAPPRWPDSCPTPPGATTDGCVVSGRLSRLQAAGDVMTGSEQVLIEDWCQQYPSHSVGALQFGPDGALYLSSGDGASFTFSDYGQEGIPPNPCGDPPGGVGTPLELPTAEGGALRSQDLRTSGDPATLDGTVIRVDPATGDALPSNPLFGSSDENVRRIIAYGQRQSFRFTFRPGTDELWVGEVGWGDYEEINRVLSPTDAEIENFGWPCYEGTPRGIFDDADFTICEDLYDEPEAHTAPYYEYLHSDEVVPGESCPVGTSSISGIAFNSGSASSFPAAYEGALFFADYSRDCIWAMRTGGGGLPSPGQLETFVAEAASPVNLEFGPDGALYYVDFDGGTIQQIQWVSVGAPTVTGTTPPNGATGVVRGFSPTATFSEPMDPSTLTTSTFTLVQQGTGTPLAATVSYDVPSRTATLNPDALLEFDSTYTATVQGGPSGARDLDGVPLPGDFSWTFSTNDSPTPVIDLPDSSTTWEVGESIGFAGHATDTEQGTLPASALSWTLLMHHCPSTCHTHTVAGLDRGVRRLVQCTGPRIPVPSRTAADSHRPTRGDRHDQRVAATGDGRSDVRVGAQPACNSASAQKRR